MRAEEGLMAGIHSWWKSDNNERFWLEVTRRSDIGANLKAPQAAENGQSHWSYSLIKELRPGDVVFHYDGSAQQIVASSRVVGEHWEDEVLWAARGTSARTAGIEAHLHAQVQQVFIKKAYSILTDASEFEGDSPFHTQIVVSSHSSHVAHETPFDCLRYFRRLPAGMKSSVPVSAVLNMTTVFGEGDDTKRFVTRYLKANHCDLFFADAVILLEGPAERMLVPHFIRRHFSYLNQCYISLLEIGGSHAHRLRPLLEHLGLLTLIITDIDAGVSGKAVPTARGAKQTSNNPTIKGWVPELSSVDDLLTATIDKKLREQDSLAAVLVAYQTAIEVEVSAKAAKGKSPIAAKSTEEALPSTFEDSLAFTNIEFFKTLVGSGLVAKFRDAMAAQNSVAEKSASLFEALRDGKKAEFALDVIDAKDFDNLKVPKYIADGLSWLEGRLKKKQVEILGTDDSGNGELS
jgi:hypothetical protein